MNISVNAAQATTALNKFQIKQAVDISMIKKTMDLQESQFDALISQMSGVMSSSGARIDTRA